MLVYPQQFLVVHDDKLIGKIKFENIYKLLVVSYSVPILETRHTNKISRSVD